MSSRPRTAVLVGAIVALVLTGGLAAEELTLAKAISLGAQHNFGLEAARADVEVAELGVRAAKAGQMPVLNVAGSYGTFDGDVLFSNFIPGAPPGGTDIGSNDGNSVLLVELGQVLYAGGAYRAAKRISGVEHGIAQEELRRKRLELSYEVASSYYNVLLAEKSHEVAARSVRRSEEGLEIVRRRHAEQEALQVELLGAQSQLAADQLALLEAEDQIELARAALNRLLGRELAAELELAGGLESPSGVPAEADGIRRATSSNPVVRQADLAVERAGEMVAQGRSLAKPKLELKGVYSDIDNELFFDGSYLGFVLNLSIPFVKDAVAGSAAKAQAEGLKRHSEAARQEAESSIRLAATTAYRRLKEAGVAITVAEKGLEYQQERYRVSLSAYREAMVTFSDVLDDHASLSQAELHLHAAHLQARLAEAAVRKIAGLEGGEPGMGSG